MAVDVNRENLKQAGASHLKAITRAQAATRQPAREERYGNQGLQRLMQARRLQAKLTVSQPDDLYEQEADRVADAVMRMPDAAVSSGVSLQRACSQCEAHPQPTEKAEQEWLQMKPLGSVLQRQVPQGQSLQRNGEAAFVPTIDATLEASIGSLPGRGSPLPESVRSYMEPRFNADFGAVRVHTDSHAQSLARAVNAQAFTVGRDVVFGSGRYAPETTQGKHLLAHELTHVVQQRGVEALHRYATEDCDEDARTKISAAYAHAKVMLTDAIARLTASPVTANTQKLFARHFGAYAEWRRDIVVNVLRYDLSEFNASKMTFECESECDGEPGYTYWVFGDIHLCPVWMSTTLNEQAETLIHEFHHSTRGDLDLGYHGDSYDGDTIWPIAINNADSYSELAQDLHEKP